ncbi:MAG: segregation and condensation protein A [Lachnospiraceae bacterium]
MGIPVKLMVFEGPLDLLLHLIDKNKVNIYDIPIVMITQQYLDYVNEMEKTDLNVVSEFLVMAATLIDIKARMLLPKEVNEEGQEEDPRSELVEKLLEYKMYKYMSLELKDRQIDAQRSLYKKSTVPDEVSSYTPPVDLDELLKDMTLAKLNVVFQEVMKRQEDKIDPVRSQFGKIKREEVSMEGKLVEVKDFLMRHKKFSFRELLMDNKSKLSTIVTFLVVLELMKTGFIEARQEGTCSEIYLEVLKDPSEINSLESEENGN